MKNQMEEESTWDNPNMQTLDRSRLIEIKSLSEGLELFGVCQGDRVETRDLVIMKDKIEQELKIVKKELEEKRNYEAAGKVRDRLAALHEEFEAIQRETSQKQFTVERKSFEKARRKIRGNNDKTYSRDKAQLGKVCQGRKDALLHAHEIQKKNLDDFISNMHRPRVRYSKNLLDMMHSERHLCRLNQYEDARAISKRIAQQLPKEVEKHKKSLDRKEQLLRKTLSERQQFEMTKLQEKLHDVRLRHERSHGRLAQLTDKRLSHHEHDMLNRQSINGKQPEQFCAVRDGRVRPIVKKRKGYHKTDAAFRGTQLLESVQGDAIKDVISLCSIHDFERQPQQDYKPLI